MLPTSSASSRIAAARPTPKQLDHDALPLPGGVGGIEPIMLGVLTASGVNLALGAAAVILYRFVSLGIQAAAGAIAVGTLTTALQRSPPAVAPEEQ